MRFKQLGPALLLGGATLIAAQNSTTSCVTPPISICSTLQTIYIQSTITATNTISAGYVTITTVYRSGGTLAPAPSTSTIALPSGTAPGTVEIFYNPTTLTTTTLDSGINTRISTTEQSGPVPGTVQVFIPAYTTATVFDSGNTTRTSTIAQPTGTAQGTVEIILPQAGYVTITTLTIGSITRTSTVTSPSGTNSGTVEVFLPSFVTTTIFDNGNGTRTSTISQPTSTVQGTVGVFVPAYVTSTTLTTGSTTQTRTLNSPSGTAQGTVEVLVPNYVTTTVLDDGSTDRTSTISQPTGTIPGVVQLLRARFVTITTLDSGNTTRTSTIAQPTGSTQGTVEIFRPSYVTITTTTGFLRTTNTLGTPTGVIQGTVQVVIPSSTVVYCNLNGASTATPDPAATGTASNKGVQYGLWNSPYFNSPPFNENTGFANYNVTDFDAARRAALHLGKTQRIGFSVDANTKTQPIYSDTAQTYKTENITLIHRGFVYARTTGTYTFTSINPDDIILVWFGNNAVSGFNRGNANIVKSYPAGTTSVTVVLTAGQYEPFRVQWANGGVPGFLGFRINGPSGAVLFDTNGSTDVVTAACDGSTPPLPQWT